jgi:DNA-binding response OmpR family regulator
MAEAFGARGHLIVMGQLNQQCVEAPQSPGVRAGMRFTQQRISRLRRTGGIISMTLPQFRRNQCVVDGRTIRLSPMISEVLSMLLAAGPDRFVSRAEFVESLWPNPDCQPEFAFKIVDICVSRLRGHGVTIETLRHVGWLIPRVAREAAPQRLAA